MGAARSGSAAEVSGHSWQSCRLVMADMKHGTSDWAASVNQVKLEMAWSLIPDGDRRLFHDYCCLGRKSAATLGAMERVIRVLGPALDYFP